MELKIIFSQTPFLEEDMCSDLAGRSETVPVFIHLCYISSLCTGTYHYTDFSPTASHERDKNHTATLYQPSTATLFNNNYNLEITVIPCRSLDKNANLITHSKYLRFSGTQTSFYSRLTL